MQTALLSMLFMGSVVVVVGGIVAFFAVRSAPEGFENETGFHALSTKSDTKEPHYSGRSDEFELVT